MGEGPHHRAGQPPTSTSVSPPPEPFNLRLSYTHVSKCHWSHGLLGTLPRRSRHDVHRWSKKGSPVQIKSRPARVPQWSTPVLHKWDTKALSRPQRLCQNHTSIQLKPRSLKSLQCRMSNRRRKSSRGLFPGSRDSLRKEA